jgi:uncharacterized membrane protein
MGLRRRDRRRETEAHVVEGELADAARRVEHLAEPEVAKAEAMGRRVAQPAWRRVTQGEPRWPVTLAILVAIGLQIALPPRFSPHTQWLLPILEVLLLIGLVMANPGRLERRSTTLRRASMALIIVISLANASAAIRLIVGLIRGTEGDHATTLLLVGGAIWLTNVIVFALWYWELDRGGPVARAHADLPNPDFVFPQMQSPELVSPDWEPQFVDYFYVSFTNATAFSPTDTMPFSRWAKLTMMLQSAVSLAVVVLVIARAVNILK